MGQSRMWLLSLIAITAIGTVTALGIRAAQAAEGSEQSPAFDEGAVLRSSFLIGRGIGTDGQIEEITADYWLRVGPDDEEEIQRAVLADSEGKILQEGIRDRADGFGTTYMAETGKVFQTLRPQHLSSLMWTQKQVNQKLLDQGFKLLGESEVAGVPALVYEKREALSGQPPDVLFLAAGLRVDDITGVVRRVFVGNEPFGVDLGEEAGYVFSDGSELLPYYRRAVIWEALDEAPPGAFEWSSAAAGEVSR